MVFPTLVFAFVSVSLTAAAPSTHSHIHFSRGHHAIAKRAASPLMLQLQTPDDMKSVDDLTVTTTVINTGAKPVKLLNDPNGVLTPWKAHTFNVVSVPPADSTGTLAKSADALVDVSALCVKWSPTAAAASDDDRAFTILAPGENKTIVHDLSGMYSFRAPGAYTVKLAPPAEYFTMVEPDGSLSSMPAVLYTGDEAEKWAALNVLNDSVLKSPKGFSTTGIKSIDLAGVLSGSGQRMIRRQGNSKFTNCSAEQQKGVLAAVPAANEYISESNAYLNKSLGERFTNWFGAPTEDRAKLVRGHFANLTGVPDKADFDCGCDMPGTYAYVYPSKFPTMHLCGAFWKAPTSGQDSKAGTLVHESTHFTNIAGTNDYVYGHDGAQEMAKNDPDKAVMNADSHEYFAENSPRLN